MSYTDAFAPPFIMRPGTVVAKSSRLLGSLDDENDNIPETTETQMFADATPPTASWEEGSGLAKAVPLKRSANDDASSISESTSSATAIASAEGMLRRNLAVAIVSILLAVGNFFFQYSHPVTSIQLLQDMQAHAAPIQEVIGHTPGKPTLVDFWAPWCENCKLSAPTLQAVEQEYAGRVNFCMVNGDEAASLPMIEAFRVDAIPHLAMVSDDGVVETALIGPTPKSVLEADLDAMLEHKPVPYTMLDVFVNDPEHAKLNFDK